MRAKHHPMPLLGIPLGAPRSARLGSPALPQFAASGPQPSPSRSGQPSSGVGQGDVSPDSAAQVELLIDRSRHRISPMDVQAKRFTRVRQGRGYDMRQVDAFLDEVAAELVRLHEHIQHLQDQPHEQDLATPSSRDEEPEQDSAAAVAASPPLGRVRIMAVRMASDILADALCQAEKIYRTAYQQAAELLADAQHDAQASAATGAGAEATAGNAPTPAAPPADRNTSLDAQGAGASIPTPSPAATSAAGAVVAGPWDDADTAGEQP